MHTRQARVRNTSAAVVLLAVFTLAGCGDDTFTVRGSLTLPSSSYNQCTPARDYSDIQPNGEISVTSASEVLASGRLDSGALIVDNSNGRSVPKCVFEFEVSDVPSGRSVYILTSGSRNSPAYTQDELGTKVALSLG